MQNTKSYNAVLLVVFTFLLAFGGFIYVSAQETEEIPVEIPVDILVEPTPQEEIPISNVVDLGVADDFSQMIFVSPEKIGQRPAKFAIKTPDGGYVADTYFFNASETCIYTDRNLIICGSFTITPL